MLIDADWMRKLTRLNLSPNLVLPSVTMSYPLANDPGMSNTTQILCIATVDLDDPQNHNAKPRVDDEFIETHFVELPALLSTIEGTHDE